MIFFLMRPMGANLMDIPKMINVSLQNVFFYGIRYTQGIPGT